MKHFYLLFLAAVISITGYGQYYYNSPSITPAGNPGGLNTDLEKAYGNGLAPGWTIIQPATHPGWSAAQTIPFAFSFNGQAVTQLYASTTGLVTFSSNPATPSGNHNIIPSSTVPDKTICAWGLGYSGGNSNDKILTKTFGTAPNRQFWISYNSYNNEALGFKCYTYWSVVLEETSNKIYVVDQLSNTWSACDPLLTIGIQYTSTSALMVTGSPNIHPLASNSETTIDNRYYEFIPGQRPNYDMAIDYIQTNKYQTSSTPVEIRGIVRSYGLLTVNSYKINYQLDNNPVKTENVTGASIPMGGDMWYFHDSLWMATGLGVHQLKVWVDNINGNNLDQNPFNDTVFKEIEVMGIFVPKLSLHEYFNSANHNDCAGTMDSLRTVFLQHQGEYTLISYQMGTDEYATADGLNRATFYGIDSVPDMYVNGINRMDPRFYSSNYFNDFKAPAYISITPQISKSGNTITVTAALLPFPDWTNPANGMKIRIAVVELVTTGNVGTNGDTKFYSVFRKFLPGVNGQDQASFSPGMYVNVNRQYTFTTTEIENINNLGVVVYIQNDVTGEIYQSGFAQINTGIDDGQAQKQGITKVYPNPANDLVGVSYFVANSADIQFNMYDITGRVVFNDSKPKQTFGNNTQWIDVRNLKNGIYFIKMQIGNDIYTQKVVVNK